jgi:hypothetical protein
MRSAQPSCFLFFQPSDDWLRRGKFKCKKAICNQTAFKDYICLFAFKEHGMNFLCSYHVLFTC